jgi:hypothetical protein
MHKATIFETQASKNLETKYIARTIARENLMHWMESEGILPTL